MSVAGIVMILVAVLVLAAVGGGIWAHRQQRRLDDEGAGALERTDKDTVDWVDPDADVTAEATYVGTTTRVSRRTTEPVEGTGSPGPARITVRRKSSERLITLTREDDVLLAISADEFRQVRKIISPNPRTPARLHLGWVRHDGIRCHTDLDLAEQRDVEGLDAALWWHGSARAVRDDFDYEEDQP